MSIIENSWRSRGPIAVLLLPVSWLYRAVLSLRRLAYQQGWIAPVAVPLPVVVVGNLSIGGTGKTPLCAYLVERFSQDGWRPAIVSRGYGGVRRELAHIVDEHDSPSEVGDEPILLFEQTGVPVCVCVHRALAVQKIAEATNANIVFADDGLQHLSMPRVAEVLVVDGQRGFGNRWVLPAGPLRDSFSSVKNVNIVAIQVPSAAVPIQTESMTGSMTGSTPESTTELHGSLKVSPLRRIQATALQQQFSLEATNATQLRMGNSMALSDFSGQRVHAVAGIGHPQRFFDSLTQRGITVIEHAKADHADYCLADIEFGDDLPVLVTVKDAVKLKKLVGLPDNVWQINTQVVVSDSLNVAIGKLQETLSQSALQ